MSKLRLRFMQVQSKNSADLNFLKKNDRDLSAYFKKSSKTFTYIIVIGIVLFSCKTENKKANEANKNSSDSIARTNETSDTSELNKTSSDSIVKANEIPDSIESSKTSLIDINNISTDYKKKKNIFTMTEVNQDILRLYFSWKNIDNADYLADINDTINSKLSIARKTLIKYQTKMFPEYRKVFVRSASNTIESDIKIDIVDDNYKGIRFIGYDLVTEENKQALYNKIEEVLKKYRFKHAYMTPYLGSEAGSVFTVDSPEDSIKVVINIFH